LAWLLTAYVLLASLYSVVTPIFEASDELWHYPMVKYLADNRLALPVQDPSVNTTWRQEGSQPPLYYMMGAILTFWIDTSDLEKVRKINPHADIGVVVPDGNVNMIVHDPAAESFPWRGTVLAVHLVRFLSVALGAITVAMTNLLALELFPGKKWLALAAGAFTAFNPMFLFISGSVNNDNLSTALASVLLVMIVRLLKRMDAPAIREYVLLGVIAGAGMLAKFNIGFLLPIIALALAILSVRLRDWRPLVIGGAISGVLTIGIAAWWYIRNVQLYGEPTGLDMFVRIVGPRTIPANWAQLWSERHTFLMSYWGFFGGVNVPLPEFVYTIFNGIAALAAVGLVIALVRAIRRHSPTPSPNYGEGEKWVIMIGAAITVIWIVVLFAGLIRWTSTTWASQGRLMFSAIAPLSMWLAVGLWQLGRPVPLVRWRLAAYGLMWFMLIAVTAPMIISRHYSDPSYAMKWGENPLYPEACMPAPSLDARFYEPNQENAVIATSSNSDAVIGGGVPLGGYFQFSWVFSVIHRFARDWSAFIHVENDDGLIVAQRDVYLGQGLWATGQLGLVDNVCNQFAVFIPPYTYAPQKLKIYWGFYDIKTGERMHAVAGWGNATADNRILIGLTELMPRKSSLNVPNPMSVNFGGEAELVGYDISTLAASPNQQVTVTFYWRALRQMSIDYRVFTQIVKPNTITVYGADDSMPAAWSRPTTTWKPGEIIEDKHTFTIFPDAPEGNWQLIVGMYQPMPDYFKRLRVITPDGAEALDFLELTRVKIKPPEPSEIF
jgi:4-amino-4-deoxy-L-arabinose transferase-like glycosyltransferase